MDSQYEAGTGQELDNPSNKRQNIYDQQQFFTEYNKLPRAAEGLDAAPEWPTMRKWLGDVSDCDILDLGCGAGWFCRWAAENGAKSVHGMDISKNMLARAITFPYDPSIIRYECQDLESLALPANAYDLVYSALTLHYLSDLGQLFAQVAHSLRPRGRFVFLVEHPIITAPSDASWKSDAEGRVFWPLNNYHDEGLRVTEWLGTQGVRKYYHSVETYLTQLLGRGFELRAFRESWDGLDKKPVAKKHGEAHRPYFLLVSTQLREDR